MTYAIVCLKSFAHAFEDLHEDVLLLLAGGLKGHSPVFSERGAIGRQRRDQAKNTIRSQVTITPFYFSCRPFLLLGFVHLELQ